jgi:hypothetical protein
LARPCKTTTNRFLWETASVNWCSTQSHCTVPICKNVQHYQYGWPGTEEDQVDKHCCQSLSSPKAIVVRNPVVVKAHSRIRFQDQIPASNASFLCRRKPDKNLRALVCWWFAVLLCFMDLNCHNVEFTAFADSQGLASSTSFYLILVVGFTVEIRKKSSSRV